MLVKSLFSSVAAGILLACSIVVSAEESESDVISLTKDTFKTIVDPEKLILVEFFAPWCGHCKALAPEYEKAATALKSEKIKVAKVDCTAETELCTEQDVKGYPTLKVFKNGNSSEYNGGRKADLIVNYMKKQALPAVSNINVENFDSFKDSDDKIVIGFFNEDNQKEFNIFSQVSEQLRDDFIFGQTGQKEVITKAEVKPPSIVLYKKFDEGKNVLESPFTEEELIDFIKKNSIPLLAEIGPDNYASYVDSGIPLAFLFYGNEEQRTKLGKAVEPVAKDYKGQVNFVYIDADKFGQHAENLNLKQTWPAFGISKPEESLKYPFNQSEEITTEAIREFVDKFVKGEIPPSIKSEPIPEKNDDPVFVLVADNFEEVVYNNTARDVLVEFYAPWCGHCKKLAPIYEKLGETYKDAKDKILIAKMDSIENDLPPKIPFKIAGFPTIKLFKAGDKEVIDYQGDRTYENFVDFLNKNAANKVDLDDASTTDTPKSSSSSSSSSSSTSSTAKESSPTTTAVEGHEEL